MHAEEVKSSLAPQDVRMEPVENGVIISYSEKVPNGSYDYSWNYKKEAFTFEKGDKKGMAEAMTRFCDLCCASGNMHSKDED